VGLIREKEQTNRERTEEAGGDENDQSYKKIERTHHLLID
jgi:hypothetical protein